MVALDAEIQASLQRLQQATLPSAVNIQPSTSNVDSPVIFKPVPTPAESTNAVTALAPKNTSRSTRSALITSKRLTALALNRTGIWSRVASLKNTTLRSLADQLPRTLYASHAASTNKAYSYILHRWQLWTNQFSDVHYLPADPFYVGLFAIQLSNESSSAGLLNSLLPALINEHADADLYFCGENPFLREIISGLRKLVTKPRNPKEALDPIHLKTIIETLDHSSLLDFRIVTLITLGFFGFLRFNELANLRQSDFDFFDTYMTIKIRSSKTDQLRQGDTLTIGVSGGKYCPVNLVQLYFLCADIEPGIDCFIFRNIVRGQNKIPKLIVSDRPIKYGRARELVLKKFQQIGLPKERYGLHSLRAGGASSAAKAGVGDRLFQRHGRWRSAKCKDLYVRDSAENILSVTKSIALV